MNNYDSYSLIEVEAIDLITDEVFPLTFKASLVSNGYQTNIYDKDMTEPVFLKMYDFDIDIHRLIKFWIAFKVNDPVNNINNYVIRTVIDIYDVPFDTSSAKVLDFKIRKDSNFKESSTSYTIEGSDEYGFIAIYNGQGPVNLVRAEYGYSKVKALLRNESGDEVLVNLRGVRKTACSIRTMNSAVACSAIKNTLS